MGAATPAGPARVSIIPANSSALHCDPLQALKGSQRARWASLGRQSLTGCAKRRLVAPLEP